MQEYKDLMALVIQASGTDPTAVTQVTTVLFIRHLFNKKIKKQMSRAKTIQTLRHAMTWAQEVEINLKKYEGLDDD